MCSLPEESDRFRCLGGIMACDVGFVRSLRYHANAILSRNDWQLAVDWLWGMARMGVRRDAVSLLIGSERLERTNSDQRETHRRVRLQCSHQRPGKGEPMAKRGNRSTTLS